MTAEPRYDYICTGKGYQPIGFNYPCPDCDGSSHFSSTHQDWVCFDCGRIFKREDGQVALYNKEGGDNGGVIIIEGGY